MLTCKLHLLFLEWNSLRYYLTRAITNIKQKLFSVLNTFIQFFSWHTKMETMISNVTTIWEDLWERRDKRMDDYPLMSNPLHTAMICCVYFYLIIFAGPRYMKDRKPMNIKNFMIVYNALMVILSSYMAIQVRVK